MKILLAAIVFVPCFMLSLSAEEVKQPLMVDAPVEWKVEFEGKEEMQFYNVRHKGDEVALLMFSRWPAPGNVEQIPELVKSLAKGFVEIAEKSKEIELKTDKFEVRELAGKTFSGSFVQFEIEGGLVQTMFMIGSGKELWNGQFTGTKEKWVEAIAILKKLKKKG